jgi:hypothetical protein
VRTAFELAETTEHIGCRRWAHAYGWRGHLVTKSRRFSTTLCRLRQARREWRAAEAGESEVTGTTTWQFDGVGLRCEIDRMLAAGVARRRADGRFDAYLERMKQASARHRGEETGECEPSSIATWTFDGVGLRLEIDRMPAFGAETHRAEERAGPALVTQVRAETFSSVEADDEPWDGE